MPYIENPKTKGSGIVCCIPQRGQCPNGCADCFFQSGRSYLEPLKENTPNMLPAREAEGRVVRVNDGNDSDNDRELVLHTTRGYKHKFYNTACPDDLEGYRSLAWDELHPVVLTVNPGEMTDRSCYTPCEVGRSVPKNLMFVRVRTNTWNLGLVDKTVCGWTAVQVPVVLTFMAYLQSATDLGRDYTFRKRTTNSYWAITHDAWTRVMARYETNPLVYSCGTEGVSTACRHCGNCLREYWATVERMRAG